MLVLTRYYIILQKVFQTFSYKVNPDACSALHIVNFISLEILQKYYVNTFLYYLIDFCHMLHVSHKCTAALDRL